MKISMNAAARALALAAAVAMTNAGEVRAAGAFESPVGLWKMIDDRTGSPRSLVRIVESGGTLQGILEKGLAPTDRDDAICERCPGPRKGQRLRGMAIVTNLVPAGDGTFSGGEILDPDEGRIYRCKVVLKDGGTRLDVRGYLGVSLFGRTQTWVRVE